eukprot:scaffold10933_cov161-Ochromonas_danica.AAC.3
MMPRRLENSTWRSAGGGRGALVPKLWKGVTTNWAVSIAIVYGSDHRFGQMGGWLILDSSGPPLSS